MQGNDKSDAAPHSIRKKLKPRKHAFFLKPIADVEESPLSPDAKRIRAIGERAYREGGKPLMHKIFWQLRKQGTYVGGYWDGIGGWWG